MFFIPTVNLSGRGDVGYSVSTVGATNVLESNKRELKTNKMMRGVDLYLSNSFPGTHRNSSITLAGRGFDSLCVSAMLIVNQVP